MNTIIQFNDLGLDAARQVLASIASGAVVIDLHIKKKPSPRVRPACGPYKKSLEIDGKVYLKAGAVAARLGLCRSTLEKPSVKGHIPFKVTDGGHRLYEIEDVEEFARSRIPLLDEVMVVR